MTNTGEYDGRPTTDEESLEETPAAAGGHDDEAPEQGEGSQDSH